MMKRLLYFVLVFQFFSCSGDSEKLKKGDDKAKKDSLAIQQELDSIKVKSDYDLSTVNAKERKEFKENLAKIEKKHGVQWDFCTCVVKNDSINKAFSKPVSDKEFERLSERFDEIEKHCKAFLTQSPNVTPEERALHEKKVKKCLKDAGVN